MRNRSRQPRKKRKMLGNLPLHRRRREMGAHLSPELRKQYKRRSFPIAKGDKVKIVVGDHRGKIGKVTMVDRRGYCIGVEKVTVKKPNGKELPIPIRASKVIIVELNMADVKRKSAIDRIAGTIAAPAQAK